MAPKTYKTIIIGAGISGLGCAHKLSENNSEFRIISPDIGGRVVGSESGMVQYGAYYIMSIYHNVASLVKKGRRISSSRLMFHKSNYSYNILDRKLFTHFTQLIRLVLILRKFKKHYELFKQKSVYESQINCLKNDNYLWELYNTDAEPFIEKKRIKDIVYDYLAEVLHGTTFTPIRDLNAFTFLHFSLPVIVPIYEFKFKKDEMLKVIKNKWIKDTVEKIKYHHNRYEVLTTKHKKYFCEYVVVATPPQVSQKLLKLKAPLRKPVKAHMFHLSGRIKPDLDKGEENLFDDKNRMLAIAHQKDNSYLFYTREAKPDFDKYFFNHKIIKHIFWNPAFHIGGSNLIDFIQGEKLFLIGDNNICGMEDSYIYGMYAANKIMGKAID
jgi:hypothetical protein